MIRVLRAAGSARVRAAWRALLAARRSTSSQRTTQRKQNAQSWSTAGKRAGNADHLLLLWSESFEPQQVHGCGLPMGHFLQPGARHSHWRESKKKAVSEARQ